MKQLINSLTWTNLISKLKVILTELSESASGGTTVTSNDITDATTIGKNLIKATDAATARTAIGAGTSNLIVGTTSTTAKAGNYQPTSANISDATVIGRTVLTSADAPAIRTAIGAGTSSLAVGTAVGTALGTAGAGTSAQAARADHVHPLPAVATTSANGLLSSADKTKLDGLVSANLLNRANHTGTQAISTITGVVPIAQIPTGTTATTVSLGNHSHTATQVTATAVGSGTATNVQGILAELHDRIAALEAV